MTTICPHCHATVLSTSQPDEALGYATRLLEHFVAEHFPHNPDWKPLPDLIGVLTQLDNAITIARDYKDRLAALAATPAVGGEALLRKLLKEARQYVSDSGCDEDGECRQLSDELCSEIDAALAAPPTSSETPNSLLEKWAGWKVRAGRSRGCGMSELGDYRRLVEKPMIDRYESEIASLHSENERLQDALQQAINVFDGMNDDEINVELLPRLRAALNNKRGLAIHGHGQNRDKTREDVERALAPPASPLRGSDSVQQALEPFAKIGLDVLKNHAGWANDLFAAHWAGYCLTYLDFERAAAVARTLTASPPEQPAAEDQDSLALMPPRTET